MTMFTNEEFSEENFWFGDFSSLKKAHSFVKFLKENGGSSQAAGG